MKTLWVRAKAPFAAFRWMQAGAYRATSPVIPPSAAWGLLLNLAHVDVRAEGNGMTTVIRADAPPLCLAVGVLNEPNKAQLYQQLHSYPVGNASKNLKAGAHGAKYHIAPARREILVDFDAVVGVRSSDSDLLSRVEMGLRGELDSSRYGLPFAGDNNLLFDRLDVLDVPPEATWYAPLAPGAEPLPGSCRLTIGIDREDSSRTTTSMFAPCAERASLPPEGAWIWTPRAPD